MYSSFLGIEGVLDFLFFYFVFTGAFYSIFFFKIYGGYFGRI